jgi:hypothetical protein
VDALSQITHQCFLSNSKLELMRVSVVGTVHVANGLANAVELQAILKRLQPNVIFAEIPPAHVGEYIDGSRGSLESVAVRGYREGHRVAIVPVDLAKPEDAFFTGAKDLFDAVERTSHDYRRMVDRHGLDTRLGGFPYLNSGRCMQAWADIYAEVRATVEWIGNRRLREIYDLWIYTNERRDNEMLTNIEDHCSRQVFDRGLLLVGAAHRKSIVDKARAADRAGAMGVEWDFGGVGGGPL